ncbi:MAG: NADH-quinone oxidoreductase subunit N [Acidobacteria bacterium]|nr:NADH-quinone oxidoreductase subunit N [Acidobacteriota bacterium]
MSTVQASDFICILPQIILSGFAILVMVFEPFVPAARRVMLGWFALFAVASAGAALAWTSTLPGTAFGGSVEASFFSIFFMALFLLVAALCLLGSFDYLARDHVQHGEYYALILMATVGMCFMASSTELILVFLGLEISSISTYILAGFKRQDALSNESALKYFLLGSFATAFFLYGIAFVYGLSGTTNLTALAERIHAQSSPPIMLWVALLLMFIGLAFKVSTAPFHVWTPDVYQGAPAPVTAFLSVGPKAAAFAVMLRVFLVTFAGEGAVLFWLLWISAALTMIIGNLGALAQTNVKRMLAYSAIAHAGYVLVGLATGGEEGSASVMFYLLVYALMNVGAFLLIAHLAGTGEHWTNIEDFRGLGFERPGVAACLTALMLSLGGFPTTAGFLGKFYLFRAAVGAGLTGLTVIAVVTSVISVYYYLRLVVVMYMQEGTPQAPSAPMPWPLRVALAVCVAGIFLLGLFPGNVLTLAHLAAMPLP